MPASAAFTAMPMTANSRPVRKRRLVLWIVVFSVTAAHVKALMRKVTAILLNPSGDGVHYGEIELREPAHGEAVVRVLAAPIHPADLNTIEGKYPGTPVLGREGAGEVVALGPATTGISPGTRVLLPSGVSTWCEACICRADQLVSVPNTIAIEQAATIRINPGSALRMLRDFVPLKRGDWLLQNAANSAVGRAVVQLAGASGVRTVNLVRRQELIERLRGEGADAVLLDGEHAVDRIREIAPAARLALNAVGGESAQRLADALGDGGTLVTYGGMSRQPLRLPNGLLIFKEIRAVGFWYSRWVQRASTQEQCSMLAELLSHAARGTLRTEIEKTYKLTEVTAALEHAKQSGRSGKVLFAA
jgi:mitochondrial enoyl-[acyl-carrier protein] reductase / trans-2-enoyl-CoA reductase